jgi:hypothetical protein
MKKTTFLVAAIVFVGILVAIIKFIIKVAPGNNTVIKNYYYYGKVEDFLTHVRRFSNVNPNITSKITDTTGNSQIGYSYYLDIELKNNGQDVLYSISCDDKSDKGWIAINLVMAFDKQNKKGGYNKNVKDIEPLIEKFDSSFVVPFRNTQNIKLASPAVHSVR